MSKRTLTTVFFTCRKTTFFYSDLRQKLGAALVLRRPDVSKSFHLQMDWNSLGLEAVLTQNDDLLESMLLLMLCKALTRRRVIILVTREKHWRWCGLLPILGCIFMINTLLWWRELLRWLLEQQSCIELTNLDAYGLSRNPSSSVEDLTGAQWHGDCDRKAVLGYMQVLTSFYFLVQLLRVCYRARIMRLINLKLL